MLQPATTSELLLAQVVGLLTEVRDLLGSGTERPSSTPDTVPTGQVPDPVPPAGAPPVARPAAPPGKKTSPRKR